MVKLAHNSIRSGIMTEKRFKEVIFTWIDSGGEYRYERRIVRDIKKDKELKE